MIDSRPTISASPLADADLQLVLSAWQSATDRLQATHRTLREEVRRLSDELEAKTRELSRQNRLADLGLMAAHVAHEVRNCLAPVTLYLSLLRRRMAGDEQSLSLMDRLESGFISLDATVNDLLQFTSPKQAERRPFVVADVLRDVCESLSPQLSAQRIRCEIDAPRNLVFSADAAMLRRAVLNLALNAIDAMPGGGELILTACRTQHGLEIEVADSGPGLSDRDRLRVFEPFFTTKSNGIGLGLSIVYRIAEAHGGGVLVRNCPQGGAAFTVHLPYFSTEGQE